MKLRLKMPRFARNMASRYLSKILSEEFGCDAHIQVNESEIGMRDGRVYAHASVDADINRKDLIRLIKTSIKG